MEAQEGSGLSKAAQVEAEQGFEPRRSLKSLNLRARLTGLWSAVRTSPHLPDPGPHHAQLRASLSRQTFSAGL